MSIVLGTISEREQSLIKSRQAAWDAVIVRDNEINITVKNLRAELDAKTFDWQAAWFGGLYENVENSSG